MPSREFVIDGIRIQQRNLGSEDSLRGLNMIMRALGPAAGKLTNAQDGDLTSAIGQLVGSLDCLPDFSRLFTPACSVDLASIATPGAVADGSWQPLSTVKDQIFGGGKVARHVSWVVQCAVWEYADFLGGNGRRTLQEMASALKSLGGSTAQSGGSTPTS